MAASSFPPANITFNELEFAFPLSAKLHSINEHQTIFAYLIEEDELIISKSYQIHIIRLNEEPKHKISDKLPSKPNDIKFITINNSSKSIKKKNKLQYSLVIGYENGEINVMDMNCHIFFHQHISNTSIKSISLHFDNCFYSYCPSLILNCQCDLLFITADEIYRTLSNSLSDTLKWNESNDMDAVIATLWSPKKIILTQIPTEIFDIISIPPIDLMKHGIKLSLLDPEPPLNLYTSNQLFLIIIGYQPCITYVQIEKSSKGFGVREIKQGANKLVKSAFNLVTKSISFGGVFSAFWGSSTSQPVESSDDNDDDNNNNNNAAHHNARSAAQESIRNLPGTRYKIQCTFSDQNRKIEQIILSPLRRYAALIDSYGRISIFDCTTCSIIRMFKGCRGAQCGWIQLDESSIPNSSDPNKNMKVSFNAKSNTSSYRQSKKTTSFSLPWTLKNTLLLVIYIAPRGILEIYHLSIKHRLGALLFNPNGILLYHLSLFEQAKQHYGDPSHIFLCDYTTKQSAESSSFSLASFKTATIDDIDLDKFEEEDIKFGGIMYELRLSINEEEIKQQQPENDDNNNNNNTLNGFLSAPNQLSPSKSTGSIGSSSIGRYYPITFIHPTTASKVNTQNELKKNDNDDDDDTDTDDDDDDDDDDDENEELPSANTLNATNFERVFLQYIEHWKSYMADIPNALIKCLNISSESDLHKYWNILISVQLKHHSEISSFCDFLSHTIHQIVVNYSRHSSPILAASSIIETESLQFKNDQMRLWLFRDGCVTSYNLICTAYLKYYNKDKITLTLSEWSNFWISHYMRPMNKLLIDKNVITIDCDKKNLELFAKFLFGVISLEPGNKSKIESDNDKEQKEKDLLKLYKIPSLIMKSMKLPSSVLSLYLELFLFWFVTEQSHKWSWDGPQIDNDDNDNDDDDGVNKTDSSRWERMTKQMKLNLNKIYEQEDASLYPGYHWKYLLDYDALSIWLNSSRVSGFGEINADWTNERFDQFLSVPLNQTEQRYLPTLQYFVNKGGQLLGLLRDYVQNTTQLSHAFLICRVADAIYNDRSNIKKKKLKKKDDEDDEYESDSESVDPINNEWIIKSSRILKVKIFAYLLDYNHHSLHRIAAISTSQTCYMISLKQILNNYYRSGYSLHDIETDLPISRVLAKYILNEIECHVLPNKKKDNKLETKTNDKTDDKLQIKDFDPKQKQREKEIRLQQIYAMNGMFIDTLLFMFDVIDYIGKNKSYDYDYIAQYVSLQQKQLQVDYFDIDFIQTVLKNVYYIIRIVPDHINLEWLILYCLFDIYERIVSQDIINEQLNLLHKFQTCCTKILQFYGSSNMSVQLQIVMLNGELWYYVLSSLLNNHVLLKQNNNNNNIELQRDIIATSVEWIKFVSNIIDSLIVLQQQNKNDLIDSRTIINNEEKKNDTDSPQRSPSDLATISNQISALKMTTFKLSIHSEREIESFLSTKKREIGQGYIREKAYLYEDKSELASWPPKSTAPSFVYNQYLQPGTLLFFTSRSVIYTNHLKSMLNLYLQILRLHFVSLRAKISVIAAHSIKILKNANDDIDKKSKKNKIYLFDIFPDFIEFDSNLFTFELSSGFEGDGGGDGDNDDDNNKIIRYDGIACYKFKSVMLIAKKWIAGALDLSSSWNLDVNKVKRYIITELCNNYKDNIGLQLMKDDLEYNNINDNYDTNNKHLLALSLLHVVKKRICFYINQLLHSPQHQHILAGIPADCFQELLHYNDGFNINQNNMINEMNQIIKMSISNKDKKEIKQNPNKILQMNLKLTLAINSLLQHDDFYEKNSKQEINTLVQIINLLMQTK